MKTIKTVTAVLLAAAALALAACGTVQTNKDTKDVSLYELSKVMTGAAEFPEMTRVSDSDADAKDNFLYISDVDYDKIGGYSLSFAKDGSGYEIAVITVKDESDAAEVEKSLSAHLEGRKNLYKNYSPQDLPLAESAEVGSLGKYVYLIMCGDVAAVKGAMMDMITG